MMDIGITMGGRRGLEAGLVGLALAACVLAGNEAGEPASLNGFALTNPQVPIAEIRSGGPPRDGIPAIDQPVFVAGNSARFLRDDDLVVSFSEGGETRAYPLRILVWHEIVNDTVGGRPVAVTYCPLCGTAMVFDRRVGDRTLSFGVSGLLYQSDVLMYDRQTESLWSQLAMKAVTGSMSGTQLTWLPSEHLTWVAWKKGHPQGEVLSTETGARHNYSGNPYSGYEQSGQTMFPVPTYRADLPKKDWVVGVLVDDVARAYPLKFLPPGRTVRDKIHSDTLEITFHRDSQRVEVRRAESGEVLPSVKVYWFAWQAFYPNTGLWRPR